MAAALLAGAVILLAGGSARAGGTRVAVLTGPGQRAAAARVAAELGALGYEVEPTVVEDAGSGGEDLGRAAARMGAMAAVRLGPAGGIEAFAADAAGGNAVYRQLRLERGEDGRDEDLALGAVELLRACLVEIEAAARPALRSEAGPAEPARPAAPVPEPAPEPAPPRLAVDLAPMVSAVAFTAPPTVNVLIGAHLRAFGPLGFELLGVTPMVPSRIDEEEGRAEIHFGLVGGGARLGFGDPAGRWRPRASLGIVAALVRITARAEEPYAGREELVAGPMPYARLGLGLAVHDRVLVCAEALGGWLLGRTAVVMAEREVAVLGAPLLGGALGVELNLF
jgi:hypothetical protein